MPDGATRIYAMHPDGIERLVFEQPSRPTPSPIPAFVLFVVAAALARRPLPG